jgi:hypothetical protein
MVTHLKAVSQEQETVKEVVVVTVVVVAIVGVLEKEEEVVKWVEYCWLHAWNGLLCAIVTEKVPQHARQTLW